jgi:hypothetical protein
VGGPADENAPWWMILLTFCSSLLFDKKNVSGFLASRERNTNFQKNKSSNFKDVAKSFFRAFEELIIVLYKEQ